MAAHFPTTLVTFDETFRSLFGAVDPADIERERAAAWLALRADGWSDQRAANILNDGPHGLRDFEPLVM